MIRKNLFSMASLAVCCAGLLAANEIARPTDWSIPMLYLYWFFRIALEAFLFLAVFLLLTLHPTLSRRTVVMCLAAAGLSYVPFVLTVTALDIVLGLPELGWPYEPDNTPSDYVSEFALELGYLLDNHLFLCLILSLPLIYLDRAPAPNASTMLSVGKDAASVPVDGENQSAGVSPQAGKPPERNFLSALAPPFKGPLLRAEAQEHYVRLVGTDDSRMVLYRFSDILRELPTDLGLQVHRSHWVAFSAVESVYQSGNNTRIKTTDNAEIPVSRRFRKTVLARFSKEMTEQSGL